MDHWHLHLSVFYHWIPNSDEEIVNHGAASCKSDAGFVALCLLSLVLILPIEEVDLFAFLFQLQRPVQPVSRHLPVLGG